MCPVLSIYLILIGNIEPDVLGNTWKHASHLASGQHLVVFHSAIFLDQVRFRTRKLVAKAGCKDFESVLGMLGRDPNQRAALGSPLLLLF